MKDLKERAYREIPLSKGQIAFVDEDLYDLFNQYKWHVHYTHPIYYARKRISLGNNKMKAIYMHHAVIGYPLHGMVCDHINGNGLDNRRSNLRHVSKQENSRNRRENRLGQKHVNIFRRNSRKPWFSQVRQNGKVNYLGSFFTEAEAINAYEAFMIPPEKVSNPKGETK